MEERAHRVSDRVAKQVAMTVEMLYRWIRARDEFLLYWGCGGHGCLHYAGCESIGRECQLIFPLFFRRFGNSKHANLRNNQQFGWDCTDWYVLPTGEDRVRSGNDRDSSSTLTFSGSRNLLQKHTIHFSHLTWESRVFRPSVRITGL